MDFEFHIAPKIRKSKKGYAMSNADPIPQTVSVNDKIEEARTSFGKLIVDHPEIAALGMAALCYVSYQHGRNRAFMDTMRLAALDNRS